MPLSFEFEFFYPAGPRITIGVLNPETGLYDVSSAHIDTGAEMNILDALIAQEIGLSLDGQPQRTLLGVGGGRFEAAVAEVELRLLDEEDLSIVLPVAFAPVREIRLGNLLGLVS